MMQSVAPPHSHPVGHPKWRADIDGLRAVAVLPVVLFHAFPHQIGGGYIGVDIFFVISGFLISSIIFGNLDRGTFSFADFYGRRVRRIFPALSVVLLSCWAVGWFVLLADEYEELGKELAGGAAFVSNFVLWSSSGYFDSAADLKPLLHLWSLGIEEQFYMVWPLFLWFAWKWKTNLLVLTIVIAVGSFALNVISIAADPTETFYSPITRFWELLAGATLAYVSMHRRHPLIPHPMLAHLQSVIGIVMIAAGVFLLDKDSTFPGYWALLPVLGAVLLIAAGEQACINRHILSNKAMVWVGLISYPLYLWHWPLLAFPRIIEAEAPDWPIRVIAVVAAVVLAWLTYILIETPVRNSANRRSVTIALTLIMLVIGSVGLLTYSMQGIPSRPLAQATTEISAARVDYGTEEAGFENRVLDLSQVQFKGQKADTVLFLGDSLMTHYFPRVKKLYADPANLPVYSSTFAARPGCRPIPNGDMINSKDKDCDAYYAAVMALAAKPEYTRIVLSANWQKIFSDKVFGLIGEQFTADLQSLQQQGKKIIFISMSPTSKAQEPEVIVRNTRLAHLTGNRTLSDLDQNRSQARKNIDFRHQPQWQRLNDFAAKLGASVIDPFETLCNQESCPYFVDSQPIYRDMFHIRDSKAGELATYIDKVVAGD